MADTDKNIYSLVLSDDVIDEIDSMARSAGLSRSAMVNQILAEKTRCITPEMRVKQITNAIREAVGGEFYLAQQPSPATVACRTALKYRYKPTLRYSVELFAVARKRTGELKVSVRSQSGQLNDERPERRSAGEPVSSSKLSVQRLASFRSFPIRCGPSYHIRRKKKSAFPRMERHFFNEFTRPCGAPCCG